MPNWCENRAYIETTPEEIAAIVAAIQSEGDKNLLNYLRPEPEHGPHKQKIAGSIFDLSNGE
jgi:hypothetical protein